MPVIRAVVSDMGQVVLWFDNNIFIRRLAELTGLPFEHVKDVAHANLDLIPLFDGGRMTPPEFKARVFAALGVSPDVGANMSDEVFWNVYADIFRPNEPVIRILRRIKSAGYGLVLLSNTDPERFSFVKTHFPEVFFFDAYALSYELGQLKPAAAIYLEAARRAASAPGECVFIDDMEANVNGAVDAGLKGILYKPETDLEAELKNLGLRF